MANHQAAHADRQGSNGQGGSAVSAQGLIGLIQNPHMGPDWTHPEPSYADRIPGGPRVCAF